MVDEGEKNMETKNLHIRIDSYLASLRTDSDKLTQFYDASIIAKNALIEVDKLKNIIEDGKVRGICKKLG